MRLLSWLITIPLAAAMVLFAMANRHPVSVSGGPLGGAIDMPLFLPVLLALLAGFLLGSMATGLSCALRLRLPAPRGRLRTARDLATLRDDLIRDGHRDSASKE